MKGKLGFPAKRIKGRVDFWKRFLRVYSEYSSERAWIKTQKLSTLSTVFSTILEIQGFREPALCGKKEQKMNKLGRGCERGCIEYAG